jgi:hypothetical protein
MEIKDIQDIKRVPNLLEFSKSLKLKPMRQVVVLSRIIGEVCSICSDNAHVEMLDGRDLDLDRIVFTEHGVCPKCKQTIARRIELGYSRQHDKAALSVGLRGGKMIGLALLMLYAEHKLMTLEFNGTRVPAWKYYGLAKDSMLLNTWHGVSTAVAAADFKDSVSLLRNASKSHSDYLSVLDHAGQMSGQQFYELTDTLFIDHRAGFTSMPEYNDIHEVRGKTRFFTALDEIAWSEDCNPGKLWKACDVGSRTMQLAARKALSPADVGFGGTTVMMTSRRDKHDAFAMIDAEGGRTYKATFASWEFNNAHPGFSRAGLEDEYRKDPSRASRDFEGIV